MNTDSMFKVQTTVFKKLQRCPRVKCYEHCKQFEVLVCNKLKKTTIRLQRLYPTCNPVSWRAIFYSAKSAQKNYETTRSESRQGIAITPEELKRVDAIVSPLVVSQSIHAICVNNADDIMRLMKRLFITTLMQGFYL